MKRATLVTLALLALAAIAFFTLGPGIAERSMNRMAPTPLPTVTPATKALHDKQPIADLHADSLLWKRDLLTRSDRGQVALVPRAPRPVDPDPAGPVAVEPGGDVVTSRRLGIGSHRVLEVDDDLVGAGPGRARKTVGPAARHEQPGDRRPRAHERRGWRLTS